MHPDRRSDSTEGVGRDGYVLLVSSLAAELYDFVNPERRPQQAGGCLGDLPELFRCLADKGRAQGQVWHVSVSLVLETITLNHGLDGVEHDSMKADDLMAHAEEDDAIAEPVDAAERDVEWRDGGERVADGGAPQCGRPQVRLGLHRHMREHGSVKADSAAKPTNVVADGLRRHDRDERRGIGLRLGPVGRHSASIASQSLRVLHRGGGEAPSRDYPRSPNELDGAIRQGLPAR